MTHKELASLNDIYQLLKDPEAVQQTSYILQCLWCDLSSEFDIVGPYFTNPSTMENKFVMACIMETIKLFQFHRIKISLLVCDGESPNVSVIKKAIDTVRVGRFHVTIYHESNYHDNRYYHDIILTNSDCTNMQSTGTKTMNIG